jgi:TerC family integral membrane protein
VPEAEETFGPLRHTVRRSTVISAVSPLIWIITVVVLVAIMVIDLAVIGSRQRTVTTKDAVRWVLVYIGLAAVFAVGLFVFAPGSSGQEFVAGYITEYSLSVDNLFVFMIIMARFGVPELAEDKVLYIGIVLSLVLRAVFIFAGAAAIAAWSWVFYILGGFLVYTAIQLALEDPDDEPDFHKNPVLRFLHRILPLTDDYDGRKLLTRLDKRRMFTPLVIVIAAIGIANVVFALDSIPAIFGLTNDAYIIFTANALALTGSAAVVLPDRRAPGESRLPQQGTGRRARLHRDQAHRRGSTPLPPRPPGLVSSARDRNRHVAVVHRRDADSDDGGEPVQDEPRCPPRRRHRVISA